MKRASIISTVTALVLTAALASALAASAATAPPRAELSGFVCQKALDPTMREVSITVVMRPVTGTRKMQMEIELFSRAAGAPSFAAVSIPAQSRLDTWITAPGTLGQRPGDIWKVKVPVADLAAPATYRYDVEFRWVGTAGRVLETSERSSAGCYQPELRPILSVHSFTVEAIAGRPKLDRYVAVIGNSGATAAKNFDVQLSDSGTVETDPVTGLHAHSEKTLTFTGPLCDSSAAPTLTVDPQHLVDTANSGPVTAATTCPAPTSAALDSIS
jgi:hypothetical protein